MFFYFSAPLPRVNNTDGGVSILTDLTLFELYTVDVEDISFLEDILNCMPNLLQLTITFMLKKKVLSNIIDVLDGTYWQELLSQDAPRLCKFDLFVTVVYNGLEMVDLDDIVDSFEYFITRYDDWNMTVSRWFSCLVSLGKFQSD